MTFTWGARAFTATATPETSPPPPTGTSTASSPGTCSTTSSPSVPWPAMISSSSKGWTKVSPSSRSSRRASRVGLVVARAGEDHPRPVAAGVGHLHDGGGLRHHDGGRDPQPPGVVGHRLGVVPGRGGDEPAGPLRLTQGEELVQGAALLVGARHLEVVELEERLGPREPGEGLGAGAGRQVEGVADAFPRRQDVFQRDHGAETTGSRGAAPVPPGCGLPACRRWSSGGSSRSAARW